ncbi:MAG: hypothetical protein IT204_14040 [Fimbriimonadaceae bacterium]|nr:hypothetical protein [Fimbriimonadaceae bacterium]
MSALGEPCKTLGVRWERHTNLLLAGLLNVLLWTWLVATGRVCVAGYVVVVLLTKAMVAAVMLPAAARRVTLHEHGLVVQSWSGLHSFLFSELEAVYLALWPRPLPLPGEPPVSRVLRLQAGPRMASVLDDIEDFDGVLDVVSNAVNTNLGARVTADFDAGREVWFGPLQLHRERGVSVGERTIAWADLGAVGVDRGHLVLGDGLRVRFGVIANPQLLLRLFDQQGVNLSGLREALAGQATGRSEADAAASDAVE